ncbi:C40 family peptidase [Cohnella panacarvi]|uniref:C40 family peptidase n=1 Tax=Cohnella panacarvi TaxID=400776 RepID=UPI00047AF3F8|nr:C40 family peptidase [Cohnella panacarvi]
MRKFSVILFSLALLLLVQVGSVFASSKLDEQVDKLIGIDYHYGGTTTKGFDCSGFTQYVFKQLGIDLLRTSRDQATQGKKVSKDDLRPGDLVFFKTNGKTISHVGIFVGDGKFAHASTRKGITISSMSEKSYASTYVTARRVMDTETYQALATEYDPADEELIGPESGATDEPME